MYQHQELTHKIIAAAIEVHKILGPGLLESAYRFCIALELQNQGLCYQQEVNLPLLYKSKRVDCGFRIDFLVEDAIVLELKSVESMLPVHKAQLLTYLRLTGKQIGLLINFNIALLKHGIYRCVFNAHEHVVKSGATSRSDNSFNAEGE